ncbi:MAG: hypothetical protein JWO31_948 [Phycisphaerales bacterium]|nr:hypothetical protein [Phycisphaerales bacterium]
MVASATAAPVSGGRALVVTRPHTNPTGEAAVPPRARRAGGFTLVELLMVVGIVAGLTGILLPSLAMARRRVQAVECLNNLRTLGIGMSAYAAEFRGVLPWEGYAEGDRPTRHLGPWDEPSSWFNAAPKWAGLEPYNKLLATADAGTRALPKDGDKSVFVCPAAGPAASASAEDAIADGYVLLYGLDQSGAAVRRKTFWCYAYNTQLDEGVEDRNVNYRVTVSLAALKSPGETIVLAEKLVRPDEADPPYAGSVGQQEISQKEFAGRHDKGGHLLFADGHVAWFGRAEVTTPTAPGSGVYSRPGFLIWDPRYGK